LEFEGHVYVFCLNSVPLYFSEICPSFPPQMMVSRILSCDGVTIDGVWIGNWIYWTTPHKSLLHTGQCSQSRSVTASNSGPLRSG
jgi:hypothetical protein